MISHTLELFSSGLRYPSEIAGGSISFFNSGDLHLVQDISLLVSILPFYGRTLAPGPHQRTRLYTERLVGWGALWHSQPDTLVHLAFFLGWNASSGGLKGRLEMYIAIQDLRATTPCPTYFLMCAVFLY